MHRTRLATGRQYRRRPGDGYPLISRRGTVCGGSCGRSGAGRATGFARRPWSRCSDRSRRAGGPAVPAAKPGEGQPGVAAHLRRPQPVETVLVRGLRFRQRDGPGNYRQRGRVPDGSRRIFLESPGTDESVPSPDCCPKLSPVVPTGQSSGGLLVLQRRFLSLVGFGVKIASVEPRLQSCQGCGMIAVKWYLGPLSYEPSL